jgi:Cd2+/Zn2+-exporting ATPase
VAELANKLGISHAQAELLPEDKSEYITKLMKGEGKSVAFVGDGMNDAPVLALSDVGIAMGGLGSDAAIESADVVIQNDMPSRVATAVRIGKYTSKIVRQNIAGAIGVKVIILIAGAIGYASLWGAVFADVGVALIAVGNSMRVLYKK